MFILFVYKRTVNILHFTSAQISNGDSNSPTLGSRFRQGAKLEGLDPRPVYNFLS